MRKIKPVITMCLLISTRKPEAENAEVRINLRKCWLDHRDSQYLLG